MAVLCKMMSDFHSPVWRGVAAALGLEAFLILPLGMGVEIIGEDPGNDPHTPNTPNGNNRHGHNSVIWPTSGNSESASTMANSGWESGLAVTRQGVDHGQFKKRATMANSGGRPAWCRTDLPAKGFDGGCLQRANRNLQTFAEMSRWNSDLVKELTVEDCRNVCELSADCWGFSYMRVRVQNIRWVVNCVFAQAPRPGDDPEECQEAVEGRQYETYIDCTPIPPPIEHSCSPDIGTGMTTDDMAMNWGIATLTLFHAQSKEEVHSRCSAICDAVSRATPQHHLKCQSFTYGEFPTWDEPGENRNFCALWGRPDPQFVRLGPDPCHYKNVQECVPL